MKSGKIIALGLLALLPFAMKAQEAQEIEKLNARVDSLSQETTTLDKSSRNSASSKYPLISRDNSNMARKMPP